MTFEKWLDRVDSHFIMITGLDRDSWPDQDYWSMWDAGDSPREAVIAAIENEYGEDGLVAFGLEIV
jgi:hypothetical protein